MKYCKHLFIFITSNKALKKKFLYFCATKISIFPQKIRDMATKKLHSSFCNGRDFKGYRLRTKKKKEKRKNYSW